MSCWFFPQALMEDIRSVAQQNNEFILPAGQLPDLSRAQGPEQIADWLRQLNPQAAPEDISAQSEFYWRMSHELLADDIVIVPTLRGQFMVGEVSGVYRHEPRSLGTSHILPVEWVKSFVPTEALPKLRAYPSRLDFIEIVDDEVLETLKQHLPGIKKGHASFFRWLSIAILISELVYFWPRT
jgi:predicted Mrr-cat superfamily restriction endonuclease